MERKELFQWCKQHYGTEPDYPWNDGNAVLRHTDNKKWYGVVLEVDRRKLGMTEEGMVDILNVKCDPVMIGYLLMQSGFYPAYHMNKDKWISVMLGREETDEVIKELLSLSYELTKGNRKKY